MSAGRLKRVVIALAAILLVTWLALLLFTLVTGDSSI